MHPSKTQNLPHISEIAPTKRYERSRSPSVRRNSIRLRCLTPSRCIGSWSKLNRYFGYPSASFVNGRNSRSSTLGSCTLIDTCTCVPFPLTHNEVALQLTNNAHAHLVAFRPQMHVQRIFQGWSVTHSRTSVTRESYARIRKIILLPSSQRPARTQIESRAFVEDLRTLQQPDIVRKSLTFDRHAFAMFHIVDDPRQIRGSCIVVDEIVLHTLEGIAVTHHFACGYVFVEDLPYDLPQPRT